MTGRRKKRRRKTEERESGGGQRSTVGGNLIPTACLRLRRKHQGQKGRAPLLKAPVLPDEVDRAALRLQINRVLHQSERVLTQAPFLERFELLRLLREVLVNVSAARLHELGENQCYMTTCIMSAWGRRWNDKMHD